MYTDIDCFVSYETNEDTNDGMKSKRGYWVWYYGQRKFIGKKENLVALGRHFDPRALFSSDELAKSDAYCATLKADAKRRQLELRKEAMSCESNI